MVLYINVDIACKTSHQLNIMTDYCLSILPCGTGAGGGGEESPAGNGRQGALSPSVTHGGQTSEQTAAL